MFDTRQTEREDETLCGLFERNAKLAPDQMAAIDGPRTLSYDQLNDISARIASYLYTKQDVRPESRVAICMRLSCDMLAAILGATKTGAAVVPIDTSWPPARIAEVLSFLSSPFVIADALMMRQLGAHTDRTLASYQDVVMSADTRLPGSVLPRPHPDNLAIVTFTSGSTGVPKGVMIPYAAAISRVRWMQGRWPLTPGDRTLLHRAPSTIAFYRDCLTPLTSGSTIVIAPGGEGRDIPALVRCAIEQGVTQFSATPTTWNLVLDYIDQHSLGWSSLKVARAGGEPLHRTTYDRLKSLIPSAEVWSIYGLTECSAVLSSGETTAEDESGWVALEHAADGVSFAILDEQLAPVETGVVGELYVSGDSLARGYLGRPGESALRLVADPHAGGGSRLLRTGDRARRREDGRLEVLGRDDLQTKIGGFRIEVGELEGVLRRHPNVRDTAVVAVEHRTAGRQLHAFVTLSGAVDAATLRPWLENRVPRFLVPTRIMPLPELPKLGSGKVDRSELRSLALVYAASTSGPDGAGGSTAAQICGLWRVVLGVDNVPDQNFFEQGGNSILAMKLLARIFDTFGVEVPLSAVFEAPTIEGLAAVVDSLYERSGA